MIMPLKKTGTVHIITEFKTHTTKREGNTIMKKSLFAIALLFLVGTTVTACSDKGYVPPGGQHQSGGHGGHSH